MDGEAEIDTVEGSDDDNRRDDAAVVQATVVQEAQRAREAVRPVQERGLLLARRQGVQRLEKAIAAAAATATRQRAQWHIQRRPRQHVAVFAAQVRRFRHHDVLLRAALDVRDAALEVFGVDVLRRFVERDTPPGEDV